MTDEVELAADEVKLAAEGTIMAEFQKERTEAISEMFDGVDKHGIYPTTQFFVRLDRAVEKALLQQKEREEVEKVLSQQKERENNG